MTTATYESAVRIGSTEYRLLATADPDLVVRLSGSDLSGALVAEGELRLPAEAGSAVGKVLGQVLDAMAKLGAPRPAARSRPANANQPWTADLDDDLRTAWLAAEPDAPTADLIRGIALRMERSPTSIRSRLARVGCDPDVPGRPLSAEAAAVLGVRGRDQGGLGDKPDPPRWEEG
ncbi:hypothetical protein JOF41_000221 [Saccharothrix coeruleofusca]|uniref:hypothetical protein n=1 Tax=Saccharothrix coeruleofusca TaxID=33919 RepID=UPI001AE52D2E|nr:hypothetical protein [Saccharothrix coeruleofusca]MBP2334043.1 hypothetical protein [Saccharothrix coeruleofusca]